MISCGSCTLLIDDMPTQQEIDAALEAIGIDPNADGSSLTDEQIRRMVDYIFAWDDARRAKQ